MLPDHLVTSSFYFNVYAVPLWINTLLLGLIAHRTWKHLNTSGAGYFLIVTICSIVYSFFYGLELSSSNLATALFLIRIEYLGIAFLPPSFVLFALAYTGNIRKAAPFLLYGLMVVPVITVILALTLDRHQLLYETVAFVQGDLFPVVSFRQGIWYRVIQFYNMACILFSNIVFYRFWKRSASIYRQQVAIILVATLIPWASDFFYKAGFTPSGIDTTPFTFTFSGILIYIGLIHYRFFDLSPVVRDFVYDNIPDGVFVIDHENRIIDCNHAARNILGLSGDDIGKPAADLLGFWQELKKLVLGSQEIEHRDLMKKTLDKETWFDVDILTLPHNQNDLTGRIIVLRNITQRKKVEEDLVIMRERAEAANRAKSNFLANMSHEIRTPLNGLIGFSSLLMKTPLEEAQLNYLKIMSNSANQLLGLINDILDLSKIEAGKLDILEEDVSLEELAGQVIDMVSFSAHSKNIEILLDIPTELPEPVRADPVCLKQILLNLLGNSVKFTHQGEILLKITSSPSLQRENTCTITFSVRDTGIGISQENQKTIFEAFSQEDSSTTRKYGGTGLGLTISNKLLQLMNSSLQLDSSTGRGSTFSFVLSLRRSDTKKPETHDIPTINKVLIIESNPLCRTVIAGSLASSGVSCAYASNHKDALEKADSFEAFLIDFHVTDTNAIELVKSIRTLKPDALVILTVLATDDPSILTLSKKAGATISIIKPVKRRQLLGLLSGNRIDTGEKTENNCAIINGRYRILIAEDNRTNMLLAKTVLSKLLPDAEIFEAVNGREAVALYLRHRPDIVFMDIHMPEMNGIEAAAAIREYDGTTMCPIIAMTADSLKDISDQFSQYGIVDHITKPYTHETVRRAVSKWLTKNPTKA
ncbi:MAG: response regulator [Chlorobiaceae bacterium]|jgi:PAS domain S-box-containing protein|nr:response regulator [Chlorobiaceae bacterium]